MITNLFEIPECVSTDRPEGQAGLAPDARVREPKGLCRPVALVLCGGGARGAMEVGFYQALAELQIPIDMVIGSSVGALNGAFIAAGVPPEKLAELWCGIRRRDIAKLNWKGLLHPSRLTGLWSLEPLRQLLKETLPVSGLVHVLTRSFMAALNVKYQSDVRHYQSQLDLHVIEPRYGREVGLLDFTHTRELITAGYRETMEYFSTLKFDLNAEVERSPACRNIASYCVKQG